MQCRGKVREGTGTPRRDEGLLDTDRVTCLGTNIHTQTHKGLSVPTGLQTQSPRETQLYPRKNTPRQTQLLLFYKKKRHI